jgi:FAD/FMN-containing dehydrogenase
MSVPAKPKAVNVAYLAIDNFENVQKVFQLAKHRLGEILSAFEFFDSACCELVIHHRKVTDPLESKHPFYLVIETHGSNAAHDEEKLNKFFEEVLDLEFAQDGTLAFDETSAKTLWSMRETISESLRNVGQQRLFKYDISMPLPLMYQIILDMRERLGETAQVYGFGHLGDDNLHLNIIIPPNDPNMVDLIEPFVYEWTKKHNGSISAEHGIGLMKKAYLGYSQTEQSIGLMRTIKNAIDPDGIMNPYKLV